MVLLIEPLEDNDSVDAIPRNLVLENHRV